VRSFYKKLFRVTPLAILWLFILGTVPLRAQNGADGQVFEQIKLNSDGVTAADTTGKRWIYDFEQAKFIPDTRSVERISERRRIEPADTRCTEEKIIAPLQNSVLIGYDEYVTADVITLGTITVKGWAKGNIQSINKRVLVTESGRVDGDIKAPDIEVKPGGVVKGNQTLTDPVELPLDIFRGKFTYDGLWVVFGFTLAFLFSGFIVVTLMPRQVANINRCVTHYRAKAYLIGLLFIFLMPIIFLLLAITIVGILAIPFVPLVYYFAIVLGVVSFGQWLGERATTSWMQKPLAPLPLTMIGIALFLSIWWLVALAFGSSDSGLSTFVSVTSLVSAILITTFPLLTGIGASVLTRFGSRPYVSFSENHATGYGEAPAPAPPPIPTPATIIPQKTELRPPIRLNSPPGAPLSSSPEE